MTDERNLSQKDRKQLAKQRKNNAKQAQKYHKEQDKKAKKSSAKPVKPTSSKIEEAVNSRKTIKFEKISREEKFRRESDEKIRNLRPQDFDDGYYIDEYSARKKQAKRAKEIHEQETEVIRRNKKPLTQKQIRFRRYFLYSAIFVVVLAIGITLSLTVLFKTEKILVEGDSYYYEDQIIAFSGVELQENIFIASITGTPEIIKDNLPYVEEAKITFSIPDTITIKITDAVPSYVVENGDKFVIVSSEGRILETKDDNADNLPLLKCDKLKSTKAGDYISFDDENVPKILREVVSSLDVNKVEDITAFDITDTANIKLTYDDRIVINLGLPEDIDYKIRTAMIIINEKLDPNNTGTVEGTLDVSACNTTKMSHYKPADSVMPTTIPVTTAPSDGSQNAGEDSYTWNDTTNSGDAYGYDDSTDSGDVYGYDDGTYSDDAYGYDDSINSNDAYGYEDSANSGDVYGYDNSSDNTVY